MHEIKLLQKLISIESLSGNEKAIQTFIMKYLKKAGLKPFYVGENVVLKIQGNDSTKALIFSAHVDTVPEGEPSKWKRGPFNGVVSDKKIYGLGASDNKASVASILTLATNFINKKPNCDLYLAFVVKEEQDGSGTKSFVDWFEENEKPNYLTVSSVIGEPTNLSKIEIGHKGNIFIKVTTVGKGGHGSSPINKTEHAIFKMIKAIGKIEEVSKKWIQKYSDPLFGAPTISLTSISSGADLGPNKIPDVCSATFDVRTNPSVHDNIFQEIKSNLKGVKIEYVYGPVACGYTSKKSDIVKVFKKVVPRVGLEVSKGATDLYFFANHKIPCVVFGPGNAECAHKTDEYCQTDKIQKCIEIFIKVIKLYNNFND